MQCKPTFFGTKALPIIELSEEILVNLAKQNIKEGLTVPGVQKKLSLHLDRKDVPRLTLVDYPTGFILKPQTKEYRALPEAEDLVMDIAQTAGVRVVPHGLIPVSGEWAYITKRIDRNFHKDASFELYAMEDFCQLSGRLTQDKYKGSYEQCAKIIQKHSERPGLDIAELYMRLLICFITGNSDMHLKNFSLIETRPGGRSYILSEAYDLLPVNLVLPQDPEQTALTLNGKKSRLRRNDFLTFAQKCGINQKTAEKMMTRITDKLPEYLELCEKSYLPEDMKESMATLMQERTAALKKPSPSKFI